MGVIYHCGNAMCGRETHACRTMARPRAVAVAFESDAPSAVGTEEPKKNNGRGHLFYIDPARILEKRNSLQMSQVFPFPYIGDQMGLAFQGFY